MKDRFRFRAWDKEEKIYHYDAEETYDYMRGNPMIASHSFGDLLEGERYTVEQCTGIKDKNGRLIYEGDIVELTRGKHNWLQSRGHRFEVKFLTHRFCGFGYGYDNPSVDMCLTESKAKHLKVVGNVHENPELLEREDEQ